MGAELSLNSCLEFGVDPVQQLDDGVRALLGLRRPAEVGAFQAGLRAGRAALLPTKRLHGVGAGAVGQRVEELIDHVPFDVDGVPGRLGVEQTKRDTCRVPSSTCLMFRISDSECRLGLDQGSSEGNVSQVRKMPGRSMRSRYGNQYSRIVLASGDIS